MQFFSDLIHNPIFLAPALSWLTAQVLKTIIHACLNRSFRAERLLGSGGMPSSHSATVCALVTITAVKYGPGGFELPMSLFFAFIVMYDAMGVRRETGKQAKVLNDMMEMFTNMGNSVAVSDQLKELVGHTPLQVAVGALLGIVIGLVTGYIL